MTELFRPNSVEFVSAEACEFFVPFFFVIHVTAHAVVNSVPVTHFAKSARHNSHNFFSRCYVPCTQVRRARPLTDVG